MHHGCGTAQLSHPPRTRLPTYRVGGAKVLMAGVALWSFGTLIAPPAAQLGLWALCATRMLVSMALAVVRAKPRRRARFHTSTVLEPFVGRLQPIFADLEE
jgi:hypothetical protein